MAVSSLDLRKIGYAVQIGPDLGQQAQTVLPERRFVGINGYAVKKVVDRPAKRRQRGHRGAEFLMFQRRRGQTPHLGEPPRKGGLLGLAEERRVRRALVGTPVLLLLDPHDVRGAAVGDEQVGAVV